MVQIYAYYLFYLVFLITILQLYWFMCATVQRRTNVMCQRFNEPNRIPLIVLERLGCGQSFMESKNVENLMNVVPLNTARRVQICVETICQMLLTSCLIFDILDSGWYFPILNRSSQNRSHRNFSLSVSSRILSTFMRLCKLCLLFTNNIYVIYLNFSLSYIYGQKKIDGVAD